MNLAEYTSILGWFYYDNKNELAEKWKRLSANKHETFINRIADEHFWVFALWKGEGLLDDGTLLRLSKLQNFMQLESLRNESALKKLYGRLEKEGIRHVPIKGIDFSYRIYPSPLMRFFGDWDIWFHPDDFTRAKSYLISHGWRETLDIGDAFHHHSSPMARNGHTLEPHITLPRFDGCSPYELWSHTTPFKGSDFRRTISPELNLILLSRHASENEYRAVNITKLLLDMAFLISRYGMEWKTVAELSRQLGQPNPANLVSAFPEFFPDEILQACGADGVKASAYRQVFESRERFACACPAEFLMTSKDRFSAKWFRKICIVFRQKNLRHKHGLPPNGAYHRLACAYIKEVASKIVKFLRCVLAKREGLEEFIANINAAEGVRR